MVIAGNHDNGRRLEAWGRLTELVGVHVLGRPRPADNGGVLTLPTDSGADCVVAALPFAGPRELVSALHDADGQKVLDFGETPTDFLSIPVPEKQRGRLWSVRALSGRFRLLKHQ